MSWSINYLLGSPAKNDCQTTPIHLLQTKGLFHLRFYADLFQAVCPDSVKFHRIGKFLWQFFGSLFSIWQFFEPNLVNFYAIKQFFIIANGQILKNNLVTL